MRGVTYDAGALIAAERGSEEMWGYHRLLLDSGVRPRLSAAVLGQVWRGGPQARLSRWAGRWRCMSSDAMARCVGGAASVPAVFDLDAYVRRIGLSGRPGLAAMHRAHGASIPFENLDPHGGLPVSLELADLQRKLVRERRGGYCFEHNLLLKGALEALGAEVAPMLARVKYGAPAGVVRPRTHLVLRVQADGGCWLADIGFGR
ncbi:MAG TPA: arylamine N-acetyltransferase, partial [Solirubrobacteraceae bacterium]|nr:arylamine N-acetyltransferase [Solirubrobacteraceae bacterium]